MAAQRNIEQKAKNAVTAILLKAQELNVSVFKTRLVKLLYLLEVEHYRMYGQRLTQLVWKYHYYGPYPPEIDKILESKGIEQEEILTKAGKPGYKYSVDDVSKFLAVSKIEGLITHIVKKWGNVAIEDLLDFVYFETEPMRSAKRGHVLDFSLVAKPVVQSRLEIRIDKKKLREIRTRLSEKAKAQPRQVKFVIDQELSKNLQLWDEGTTRLAIKGMVYASTD